MRVEPEILQNLKFRRLRQAVGDIAMECLITIWAHCQQNQRGEWWPLADADYVEMLCNWTGNRGELYRALVECGGPKVGFIIPEEGGLRIHEWDEMNGTIVANWKRNLQGRGVGKQNPRGSRGEPTDIPRVKTHGHPTANPRGSRGMSASGKTAPENEVGQNGHSAHLTGTSTGSNDSTTRTHGHPTDIPRTSHGFPMAHTIPNEPNQTIPTLTSCLEAVPEILATLNQLTGADFALPIFEQEEIAARLLDVGGDLEGVKKMLRRQCALWKNDPRAAGWLKPSTLFGPKFHDYYGQRNLAVQTLGLVGPGKKTAPAADRTELLETLAATRQALEQNPADAGLQERVRELEAATA